jgi:Ca-activated chloride channel family protein
MSKQPNYYVILGLDPDASAEEIRAAAKALGEKFPKDARDPSVNTAYAQLLEAYEVLSDPEKRAAYDADRARRAPDLLDVHIQSSRREIGALNIEQLLYLLIMMRAPPDHDSQAPPLNLALVFDRSTSMRTARLNRVKAAAAQVVKKLSPDDLISIVSFSDRAEVVSPARPVKDRDGIIRRTNRVRASGGTEIYRGLQAGVNELRKAPPGDYINHLVLMTDGRTYGDEDQCLSLADKTAAEGITISAFGIGADWNDEFLDRLVAPSGGRSAYIEEPDQILNFMREQIDGLGAIYGQRVGLRAQLPPEITCNYAIKLSPYSQPLGCDDNPMQLGVVEMRAPLCLLLELIVKPQKAGTTLSIPLNFVADIPSAQLRDHAFNYEYTATIVHEEPRLSPPPVVTRAVQMLTMHRMSEMAWRDWEAGDAEGATRRMEHLKTRLMEAGHTKLANQAEQEKQQLIQLGTLSPSGQKRLKYGTRSLMKTAVSFNRTGDD